MRQLSLSLCIGLTLVSLAGAQHEEDSSRGPGVEISRHYTESKIVGDGQQPQRCSESVMQRRAAATPTVGVESVVGLGEALLIFIGVGVFAVIIAQAFQMGRISGLITLL